LTPGSATIFARGHGSGPFQDHYGVVSLYLDTDAHDVYHRR